MNTWLDYILNSDGTNKEKLATQSPNAKLASTSSRPLVLTEKTSSKQRLTGILYITFFFRSQPLIKDGVNSLS